MRIISAIKSMVVPSGRRPRHIPFGLYRGLTLDIDLGHQTQIYLGLWERETYQYLRTAAARCEWVIDVGAGSGELVTFFLRHPGIKLVVAAEPQRSEMQLLVRNLELNGLAGDQRSRRVEKCVGRSTADEFVALDDFDVQALGLGFIKIDVDGAEMDVLKSAERTLSGSIVDLLIETHSEDLAKECIAFLTERRYSCRVIPLAWWRLLVPETRPIAHNRWLWATNR